MAFPEEIKRKAMIACGRHCCICHKFCDTNMEVHHIHAHADGGSDTFENAIPLCFDCHARVRQYDPKHPKGVKFTEAELIGHRDHWYKLIQEGIHNRNSTEAETPDPIVITKTAHSEPDTLSRIYTGKALLSFASCADGMEFDYDEPSNENELRVLMEFMEEVQSLLDFNSFWDAAENMKVAFDMSKLIGKLAENHFWVFCATATRKVSGGVGPESPFKVLIIQVLRDNNSDIIHIDAEQGNE